MIRSTEGQKFLSLCLNNQWKPYYPQVSPVPTCYDICIPGLIGHWRMNEQTGEEVADDSGYENHGLATGPVTKLSKFTRGRYFDSNGVILVPDSPVLNSGMSSFTVAGWIKILDVSYPLTTFAVQKGYGCLFPPGQEGWKAGWEIGHAYSAEGLYVCIRDRKNEWLKKESTLMMAFSNIIFFISGLIMQLSLIANSRRKSSFTSMAKSSRIPSTSQQYEAALTTTDHSHLVTFTAGKPRELWMNIEFTTGP